MPAARIVTHVSSTVRRPGISAAKTRQLVETTLRAERINNAEISIAFVGRQGIARINRKYLGHEGPTDVISFGMGSTAPGVPLVADIYVCPDVARQNAKRTGVPEREEIARLVIHGTLHVAGYDHPEGERRMQSVMWKKQERILADAN